ncbi:MAG: hypothetical protein JSR12_10070 [Bacteroidetes bacterium]|nr:hypothetical protein [Bacteroidota bacterium]
MKKIFNITQTEKIITLLVFMLILTNLAHADDPGIPGGIDSDAPIDGGLSLLIAAGAGYGVKKVREMRKKSGE